MNHKASQKPQQKLTPRQQVVRLLCQGVGAYLLVCLMLMFLQRKMIYVANPEPVALPTDEFVGEEIRDVQLPVDSNVDLHGWHSLARKSANEVVTRRLAILFPGNAGNRKWRVNILNQFHQMGCDTLIFDYRGYGGSGGKPSEAVIAADCMKIWEFAKSDLGYEGQQIVLCGTSLGGGVATCLTHHLCQAGDPPAGLMLRATFTSLVDAAKHNYPWLPVSALMSERYPSVERIPEIDCPLLVLHGNRDEIVPFDLGKRLFDAAPSQSFNGLKKRFVELQDVGHNDIMHVAAKEVYQATDSFLQEIAMRVENKNGDNFPTE